MLRCSWRKQDSAFRKAPYKIQKSAALQRHSATMNFPECASLNNDPRTSLRFAIACELRAIRVQDENQSFASLAARQSLYHTSATVEIHDDARLLNMPRRESNECHGNAFHNTNCSGGRPSFSSVPQTIVAV